MKEKIKQIIKLQECTQTLPGGETYDVYHVYFKENPPKGVMIEERINKNVNSKRYTVRPFNFSIDNTIYVGSLYSENKELKEMYKWMKSLATEEMFNLLHQRGLLFG